MYMLAYATYSIFVIVHVGFTGLIETGNIFMGFNLNIRIVPSPGWKCPSILLASPWKKGIFVCMKTIIFFWWFFLYSVILPNKEIQIPWVKEIYFLYNTHIWPNKAMYCLLSYVFGMSIWDPYLTGNNHYHYLRN